MATWNWIPLEHPDVPPVVRRHHRRLAWGFVLIGAGFLPLYVLARFRLGAGPGPSWVWSIGIFIPIYAVCAYSGIFQYRLRRRVRAADGYLCPDCLYDVTGLDDIDACPECGHNGNAESMREQWRQAKALRRR